MFPWEFVKEGDTVIQVSAAKTLIPIGLSHTLMLATLVGPEGRVFVIEADPNNVVVLKAFLIENKVQNVTVIEKGIWKEKGVMEFMEFQDHTSTNRLTETLSDSEQKDFGKAKNKMIQIEVDSIDNLIQEHNLGEVSFINITINGTEYEAVLGMTEILKSGLTVAFALQSKRTFQSPILKTLEDQGYNILIKHAPVATHQKQFLVACAVKNSLHELDDGNTYKEVDLEVDLSQEQLLGNRILIKPKNGSFLKHKDFRSSIRWF